MNKELIKQVLIDVYPDDCIIVGEENIDALIKSALDQENVEIESIDGGSNFDYAETLSLLISSITIIKTTLDILDKTIDIKDKIDKNKIAQEISQEFPVKSKVDKMHELILSILNIRYND